MKRIVIVTGSRALAGSRSEPLARDLLSMALHREPDDTIVVTGDAVGPDAWAAEAVAPGSMFEHATRRWCLDGWVYDEHRKRSVEWAARLPADRRTSPRWPLTRNAMMVRSCAQRAREERREVAVIALVAAWSQTHGTAHTMRLARAFNMRVTLIQFDSE